MRYLKTVALMFIASVFVYGCGAGGAGTNVTVNDVGKVEGTITDATTSALVSGVTVQIGDKTATTGTNGVYSITDLAVGSRTATAIKTGYQNYNGTVTVTKGITVTHNIQMTLAGTGDTTPPTVSSTDPASNATNVAVNKAITVTFSEAMDCSTITASTFTLKDNLNTAVAGSISTCNSTTATFAPSSNLSYSTTYTATITTGVKDSAGNTMASNYTWTFTTGAATAAPGAIKLPKTGQTTSYATGDDGGLQKGVAWPSHRFTNADGTSPVNGSVVVDQLTGLMWTKDGNAPGPNACLPAATKTWQGALDYVACLNTNSYLGYTDWRVPNVNELESLVNSGQSSTATWLNTQGFSNVQNVQFSGYWSSTTSAYDTTYGWIVNTNNGNVTQGGVNKTSTYSVWPVRSGQGTYTALLPITGQNIGYATNDDGNLHKGVAWPSPRFTNADGTSPVNGSVVVDQLTGLMWTKDGNAPGPNACLPAATKTWQGALDYVACLNTNSYLGYTDWRLPNRKELKSLVNYSQANSATWLTTQGFSNVQNSWPTIEYWSSTSYDSTTAWPVAIYIGYVETSQGGKTNSKSVWPVRGGQ